MAKKRKTRSMKVASDLRHHKLSSSPSSHQVVSLNEIGITPQPVFAKSTTAPLYQEYHFVKHDLIKTSALTGAIILVELVLFFVVKL